MQPVVRELLIELLLLLPTVHAVLCARIRQAHPTRNLHEDPDAGRQTHHRRAGIIFAAAEEETHIGRANACRLPRRLALVLALVPPVTHFAASGTRCARLELLHREAAPRAATPGSEATITTRPLAWLLALIQIGLAGRPLGGPKLKQIEFQSLKIPWWVQFVKI